MTTHATATLPTGHAQDLKLTLDAHGVRSQYVGTDTGPSVSLHAFALESGVSVASFTKLARDLAVAVGVGEVRLHAPILGTTHVGVEVANTTRATVDYDELDIPLVDTTFALPIPVGVGVDGESVWADLATAPHLLIAGTSGSGKSVALSAVVASLIERRTPHEVRIHLIDPKRVELGAFGDAPQVERVVTEKSEAVAVLADAVDLMDTRYRQLEEAGYRNIGEWNVSARAIPAARDQWAYHVIVVDELADLMMSNDRKDVEADIVRIAQLARAAGIHLVLATQRPTVDVVTGLIKANVPSRWAFTVASATDSKVILDGTGAQALAGKGDSLWSPVGTTQPVRVQAPYITDEQVDRIVADAAATHGRPAQSLSGSRADDGTSEYVSDLPVEHIEYQPITEASRESLRHPRVRDRSENWLPDGLIIGVNPAAQLADETDAPEATTPEPKAPWWHVYVGLAAVVVPTAAVVTVIAKVLG